MPQNVSYLVEPGEACGEEGGQGGGGESYCAGGVWAEQSLGC